jgi:hypothetical protein
MLHIATLRPLPMTMPVHHRYSGNITLAHLLKKATHGVNEFSESGPGWEYVLANT